MKRPFRKLLAALLLLGVLASLLALPVSADSLTSSTFSLEQVYLNAPQCKVYFYAKDADGNSYTPLQVGYIGVEVLLDGEKVPVDEITTAEDPICYVYVLDTSSKVNKELFEEYKQVIIDQAKNLQPQDQIMVYMNAEEEPILVANTKTSVEDLERYLDRLKQIDKPTTCSDAVVYAASSVDRSFDKLNPRKVCYVLTGAESLLEDTTLLGATKNDKVLDALGMAVYVLTDGDGGLMDALGFIVDAREGVLNSVESGQVEAFIEENNESLKSALVLTGTVSKDRIDNLMQVLEVNVPSMNLSLSKYVMATHKMKSPAIVDVKVLDRNDIQVTFNEPVNGADRARAYSLRNVVGMRQAVYDVTMTSDKKTAVLKVGNLYDGTYSISLRKNMVTDPVDSDNVNSTDSVSFTVDKGYARDVWFYWGFVKEPMLILLLAAVAYVISHRLANRKERRMEAQAQAESQLNEDENGENRDQWVAVDYDGDGVVDEYVRDAFAGGHRMEAPMSNLLPDQPKKKVVLEVSLGKALSNRVEAEIEGSYIIGSAVGMCDLRVDGKDVQPQHAILYTDGNRLMIAPIENSEIKLNDKPVEGQAVVHSGDHLMLGGCRINVKG